MDHINSLNDFIKWIGKNSNSNGNSFPALESAIPLVSAQCIKLRMQEIIKSSFSTLQFEQVSGVSFFPDTFRKIRSLASRLVLRKFKIRATEFKLTRWEIAAYLANCFLCATQPASDGFANAHNYKTSFEE
jgi:hypothetical protein